MGGLLYKDFVSVDRIRKLRVTWILILVTLAYVVLRIAFPGTADMEGLVFRNEDGQMVNLVDLFFLMAYAIFTIVLASVINNWTAKIVEGDDKNKISTYISAMPLSDSAYIASKYIFIGISTYVFVSVSYIWGVACEAFCREGMLAEWTATLTGFVPYIIGLALLFAVIELPLFILMGKSKAMLVKIAFWMVIVLAAIGFIMFGNLAWIDEHFDVPNLMRWIGEHATELFLFRMCTPVIVLILYYVSYRVTCHFAKRKER